MVTDAANPLQDLSNTLATLLDQVGQSLVAVSGHRRHSVSGMVWRPDIIVAAELGRQPQGETKTVGLPDGAKATAEVVGRDPALDLVVLRLQHAGLPSVTPSALDQLRIGHLVVAAGREPETGLGASLGIVSNVGGPWQTMQGRSIDAFIRPDITLYPALLGGPLVNTQGQVIGINLIGPRRQVVTLPAITLNRIVDTLLERGQIRRGYLGVGLQPVELPANLKQALQRQETVGLMVMTLESNGPAEQGGVLIGDILLQLDHQPVEDLRDVRGLLDGDKVGQEIPVQLIRGGVLQELSLTVGVHP